MMLRRLLIGLAVVISLSVLIPVRPAAAATATVRPNGDVTAQWNTGGSSDSSCSGTHCSRIDEASPNTADFVRTDVLLGTNKTELYEMGTTSVGQGATQIKIRTYARSGLAVPVLDAMDTIVVSLWIGGQYQVGSTPITPNFPAWNWFETTFTGTWSQADVDAMRVRYVNDIQGLGLVQNDLQIATSEVEITYTPFPVITQSAYRWYQNANNIAPGSPLAATNTSSELLADGAAFRLRLGLTVDTTQLPVNYQNYKLQYALRSGTCDTSFSGESYADVAAGGGAIRWQDNAGVNDGATISSIANDPTTSGTKTYQTYRESNPLSNPTLTPVSNVAVWDFALQDATAAPGEAYCFRLVKNDGSLLDSYTVVPEVTTVGNLDVHMVNSGGTTIASPVVAFTNTTIQSACQQVAGVLGEAAQKLRITNDLVSNGWSVSMAATAGSSANWSDGVHHYDFNDGAGTPAGCGSGGDGDGYIGQLAVNPAVGVIAPKSGCSNTGVSGGAAQAFSSGVTDQITLLTGSSASGRFCYWDVTGIGLSQRIPAGQPQGTYMLDLTISIVAQ